MQIFIISDIIAKIIERRSHMNESYPIKGYIFAFLSYLLWGFLPIYWHALGSVSSIEVLLCRVVFSAITLAVYIYASKNVLFISYLKDKAIRRKLILSSVFLAMNWVFFLYAVNSSHILQASLGYYINPLFSVLLGVIFLKERLDKPKIFAISLAVVGVAYMTISLGEFPYLSLILAISFGLYGFIKKTLNVDSYNSLLIETGMLIPIAIIYSIYLFVAGTSPLTGITSLQLVLVLFSGVVTCLPLILFNEGAKRIPLSALGILQYLAPTLMLLVGVLLFDESFTKVHAISFVFIWSGYIIYVASTIISMRKSKAT